ncbi:MAG: efflux RND transporter periplasmic adaptor subunit [Desulfobacteraceae bacterium]|nr:efflux RND transporter periplasmic adaptor subunit [Desulfobacteraceae bacterium]
MKKKSVIKREFGLMALLIALMMPGIAGCKDAGADARAVAEQVRPVKAIRLAAPLYTSARTFPGSAQATREVNLAFRVAGPLVTLNGDTGDKVNQGDVLARIDPRDFRVQVKALKAKLVASRAKLTESKLQYERYIHLVKENAAAKATYDQVKATFEMAKAQVDADMKNLEAARNALTDTVLTAPFTGFIHNKLVENYETVSQGQPVFSVVDLSTIEVTIGIPENLVGQVERFTNYQCTFESMPQKTFTARLKEVGKKPNPSNRTYPLTLILNPEASASVRPGMSAEVTVSIAGKGGEACFSVPARSVVNDSRRKTFVWTVDEQTGEVSRRYVETGNFTHTGIEVKGDLHAGEWVVTAGASFLKEGQTTRILEQASKTNVGELL